MTHRRPAPRVIAALLTLALFTASCGSDGPEEGRQTIGTVFTDPAAPSTAPTTTPTTPSTPPSTGPSTTGPSTTEGVPAPDFDRARITAEKVVDASFPTMMIEHPAGGLVLVAERAGTVRPLDLVTDQLGAPLIDITDEVDQVAERGLLGLAFSPEGDFVYLSWSDEDGATRIDEFAFAADQGAPEIDSTTRRSIFTLDQPFPNHNGGHITFGPDGYLYLGLGDGGAANDPLGAGQDFDNPLGAVLRLDPFDRSPAPYGEYGIPASNPFVAGGGAPEVFVTGLRNPWRFSFDRENGDLWIADVGQDAYEEVTRLDGATLGGQNLGWALQEGRHDFEGGIPDNYVPPIAEYPHPDGCSVTGGYVYRGSAIPNLQGAYVFGDYCTAAVWAVPPVSSGADQIVATGIQLPSNSLISFAEDGAGELYALTTDAIHRIVAA